MRMLFVALPVVALYLGVRHWRQHWIAQDQDRIAGLIKPPTYTQVGDDNARVLRKAQLELSDTLKQRAHAVESGSPTRAADPKLEASADEFSAWRRDDPPLRDRSRYH